MCYFFCFKQKTAYVMRISDWSSDVCSSDLQDERHGRGLADVQADECGAVDEIAHEIGRHAGTAAGHDVDEIVGLHREDQPDQERHHDHRPQDRKSVVEGKSVTVRVAHGGRRIIKKKKKSRKK